MRDEQKKTLAKLKEVILYKRIVETDGKQITLEDGQKIHFECTEWDCCATAFGEWETVDFEGVITDIQLIEEKQIKDDFEQSHREAQLVLLHNQNSVSKANLHADNGNGDYYFSVLSLLIDNEEIGKILNSR